MHPVPAPAPAPAPTPTPAPAPYEINLGQYLHTFLPWPMSKGQAMVMAEAEVTYLHLIERQERIPHTGDTESLGVCG